MCKGGKGDGTDKREFDPEDGQISWELRGRRVRETWVREWDQPLSPRSRPILRSPTRTMRTLSRSTVSPPPSLWEDTLSLTHTHTNYKESTAQRQGCWCSLILRSEVRRCWCDQLFPSLFCAFESCCVSYIRIMCLRMYMV